MLGRLAPAGKRGAWPWEVELWPCGYVAKCSALGCHGRAATILPISTPVPSQNLNPDILMMKPAEDWYCCDAAHLLRTPKIRRILAQ